MATFVSICVVLLAIANYGPIGTAAGGVVKEIVGPGKPLNIALAAITAAVSGFALALSLALTLATILAALARPPGALSHGILHVLGRLPRGVAGRETRAGVRNVRAGLLRQVAGALLHLA